MLLSQEDVENRARAEEICRSKHCEGYTLRPQTDSYTALFYNRTADTDIWKVGSRETGTYACIQGI